ncbi:MAG: TrkH family potassium uptake protein [Aquisalimonadaceae bacterium]
MNLDAVVRILGVLLMVFSLTMLPPIAVSLLYEDGTTMPFLAAFAVTLGTGIVLFLPVRNRRGELRTRDGFLIVVLFWTVLGVTGALPLLLSEAPKMRLVDAMFESMSGLTTTGATVLTGLDELPESILYYRQQLQWLGGMGIIVLAVAILPMLGIGGMQLYRAEMPGPVKDAKLTPRIAETAKALWYIYMALTITCAGAYWLAGMTLFDAIGHSFSTVAIGGFSTHDASIGYFNSPLIEMIAVTFMVLAGINFAVHFVVWRRRNPAQYLEDPEVRLFFGILITVCVVVIFTLWQSSYYGSLGETLHHAIFQAVSIGTTAGFTTTSFSQWPGYLPVLLLFTSFIGACAASTGGGIKVIRFMLLFKQGNREIMRLIHPSAQMPVKVGNRAVGERVIDAVWGFFATYIALFTLMMLALMATGLDQVTAFSAVAACINNLGPGLGDVAAHYGEIGATAKWILMLAMLLGRLEVFTLLVLFTPAFWRR